MRQNVYKLLRLRGVSFKGRELDIQTRLPFKDLMKYIMNPAPQDRVMNIVFIFVLLLGGGALALASMLGVDF
ncbi:unnamed protein product, partial [marine sediment metagenome]